MALPAQSRTPVLTHVVSGSRPEKSRFAPAPASLAHPVAFSYVFFLLLLNVDYLTS